ncbi:Rho termination factor N-terminal domain-containing protein [Staphylococcus chromogenes]|uniref:Rho termination factor N-terminal domain-containing protein n=1 Tax=Staphylococcus chromogenes TaxID=46126 RepID=UPI0021D07CC9|nr:Rho termination factor N-terminal domain-containing protein [Staphylococcus chromogenes]UXS75860.1 Rho termination factor N-terminal domain-containing protein [Staphylococcus chromogenes]
MKKLNMERMFTDLLHGAPNSIINLLGNPTVKELKQLCKENGVKGYSTLRKEEIAHWFITSLVTEDYFNEAVAQMDENQKRLLIQVYAFNDLDTPIESNVSFPESYLIFETEEDDRGKHLLWIPDEILEQVGKWIKKHETLKRYQQEQDLIEAATNLYGLYSFAQLQKVLNRYLEHDYSLLETRSILMRLNRLMPEMCNFNVGEGLILSVGLELEPDELHHFLRDAHYYEPETLEEMLFYKTHVFGIDEDTYFNFLSWLGKNMRENNDYNVTPDELVVEILTMMKHAIEYEMVADVMYSLVQDGILRKRVEQTAINKVKPVYMKMRNWIYHGHTFEEYMEIMNQEERHQNGKVIDFKAYKK